MKFKVNDTLVFCSSTNAANYISYCITITVVDQVFDQYEYYLTNTTLGQRYCYRTPAEFIETHFVLFDSPEGTFYRL